MSNASTIRRQIAGTQQLTLAPLAGSTITTTATAFQLNNNGLTLTGGGVVPLAAGVTGLYAGTGQVIHIAATGQYSGANTGTPTTLTLQLYEVPNALLPIANTLTGAQTFTGWNAIGTGSGSKNLSSTSTGSFTIDARVQLDAAGNLEGSTTYTIDGQTIVAAAVFTPVTGLVGEADLNFAVVATLGGTETGVILTLTEFRLDLE